MDIQRLASQVVEADIEDWLYENPHQVVMSLWGIERWLGRQMRLPSGIADLVGLWSRDGVDDRTYGIAVAEIKNVPIDSGAIGQALRYGADLRGIASELAPMVDGNFSDHIWMILVGPEISDHVFAEAMAAHMSVFTFSVSLELRLGGRIAWREEYIEDRASKLADLAASEPFADMSKKIKQAEAARLRRQIPEQYRDIIKS